MWTDASSCDLKQDISDLGRDEAERALDELHPVKYAYKADPTEHHVGFIAGNVPDLVAMNNRRSLSPMDVVGVLTQVVKEQQQTINALTKRIAALEKQTQ